MIEAKSTVVKVIVRLMRVLLEGIADLDERSRRRRQRIPVFSSLSAAGASPMLAPRLLAAFGSQRDRYRNADEVHTYSGYRVRDGEEREKAVEPFSLGLPQISAGEFSQMGKSLIGYSVRARSYYQQQRNRGLDHHAAVRAFLGEGILQAISRSPHLSSSEFRF